jgi:hypothetical protein
MSWDIVIFSSTEKITSLEHLDESKLVPVDFCSVLENHFSNIVITPEHALELHRQIANSELAIIPGIHGEYMGEITTITPDFKETDLVVPMIEKFLDK